MESQPLTLLDGEPTSADTLASFAFAGFAHFTALQVRSGGVRGLDLHLERLDEASHRLFSAPAPADLPALLHDAVRRVATDVSLTVTVLDASGEFTAGPPDLRVLIRTSPPSDGPSGPLRLAVTEHERFMPSVKHVGEGAKTFLLRRAVAEGYDDVAFVDRHGHLSEASIWNLAFLDGETVVWPDADLLQGTTMAILQRRLGALDVPQETRPLTAAAARRLDGAVVMNSWTPGVPVTELGRPADGGLRSSVRLADLLGRAWATEPLVVP